MVVLVLVRNEATFDDMTHMHRDKQTSLIQMLIRGDTITSRCTRAWAWDASFGSGEEEYPWTDRDHGAAYQNEQNA
jgi:hypothetical protein